MTLLQLPIVLHVLASHTGSQPRSNRRYAMDSNSLSNFPFFSYSYLYGLIISYLLIGLKCVAIIAYFVTQISPGLTSRSPCRLSSVLSDCPYPSQAHLCLLAQNIPDSYEMPALTSSISHKSLSSF